MKFIIIKNFIKWNNKMTKNWSCLLQYGECNSKINVTSNYDRNNDIWNLKSTTAWHSCHYHKSHLRKRSYRLVRSKPRSQLKIFTFSWWGETMSQTQTMYSTQKVRSSSKTQTQMIIKYTTKMNKPIFIECATHGRN